ncbi:MAG: hypothetical protein QG646_2873 [Euryarchaeota archaeon]|nr:hypothetical protein [Euryarchaeota archaeon]
MRMKILLILLIMIPVLMSGCAEEKKQIALNQSGNVSNYEFEVFQNEWTNNKLANTTTYYLLEDRTTAKVVNLEINCSKLEIYPPDSLGGGSEEKPIQNFVLLVEPANKTTADAQTFERLSQKNGTSDINYTLTQEISENMKILNLEFKEPITGFIAYTIAVPATQSFAFIRPDSEYIRVILPPGYVTGNRIFGIARPTPSNVSFDEKGRQNLLWISSKLGERDEAIQVKYYSQSAPLLFLCAIVALLIGVVLVLFFYSRSKRELESVKGIFELEKEYEKKQRRRK